MFLVSTISLLVVLGIMVRFARTVCPRGGTTWVVLPQAPHLRTIWLPEESSVPQLVLADGVRCQGQGIRPFRHEWTCIAVLTSSLGCRGPRLGRGGWPLRGHVGNSLRGGGGRCSRRSMHLWRRQPPCAASRKCNDNDNYAGECDAVDDRDHVRFVGRRGWSSVVNV